MLCFALPVCDSHNVFILLQRIFDLSSVDAILNVLLCLFCLEVLVAAMFGSSC
jgi:hypothetical protein